MSAENKVPVIRFKGFSGEWEEKKLNQIVDIRSGRDYKHLSVGNIPVYGTGGYMLSVNKALSYKVDAIGIGRKGTIDKPYILNAPFWTVDTLFYAVPNENNNLNFIYSIFQIINWRDKDESTGVPSLSKATINNISTFSTGKPEQIKIGQYFQQLDTLIEQHQQKHNKLLNLKKALLEKIFPKQGTSEPEIRFKGFSGTWELKIFKDLTKINQGLQIAISNRHTKKTENSYFYITNEFLKENSDSEFYISNPPKSVLCTKDDVLMTRTGNTGQVVTNVSGAFHNNFFIIKFDVEELNKDFLVHFLRWTKTQKVILCAAGSSTIPDLNHHDFYRIEILLSTIKEQTKIGTLFKQLDTLINQYQSQLKKLNTIKQACLEKMFV